MEGVRRHQNVSFGIFDIAGSAIKKVLGVFWFSPFLSDELGGEKLRRRLQNLIAIIDHEEVIRAPALGACGVRRRVGQTVVVVSGLAACGKKSREGVSQPERAKDLH